MLLECQSNILKQLSQAADARSQSIIITGYSGTGKTYLAKEYSKLLRCNNFIVINPTINDIRDSIESTYSLKDDVVVCFENLDDVLLSSSYALLKFLEEPKSNVYIVVTCSNIHKLPDTIVSRAKVFEIGLPTASDIAIFSDNLNSHTYHQYAKLPIWKGATSFKYAKMILSMSRDEVLYYENIENALTKHDCVSNIMWNVSHIGKDASNIEFTIHYIICTTTSERIKKHAMTYMNNIRTSRIAKHVLLAKLVLDCKYTV